ncbi:MAG: proton-conducting transporter membrane subunit [Coriobacteriia bacterium]|nr:proton-conducting transporter membrane subunit [Coriobacteriia bacterium]
MTPVLPAGIGSLTFSLDETGTPFLILFAFLWTISGLYAFATTPAGERARLFAYFVPSALGGVTVALAGDAISFYLCFALMAIPAWGLITHVGTPEARRAGAIYLTLTAIGEAALLAALVIMAVEADSLALPVLAEAIGTSPLRDIAVALLLASIGLKIGTLPASGFLPLSYTYTPAGAASALAGASAKVGALAMLRLLPAGVMPEEWAYVVMALGMATAFLAAILGTLTTTPRAVLGYSSASQMGLILVAAGVSLTSVEAAPLAYGAIVAFSLHHGLAKSALVLGDDVVSRLTGSARTAALAALALPVLALVGAPLTSGFVAKYALKDAVHALHGTVPEAVYALLPWTAIGTAALMLRFFALTRERTAETRVSSPRIPIALWSLVLAAVALVVWIWPAQWNVHAIESALSPSSMWTALWPGLIAIAGWMALRYAPRSAQRLTGIVPPGDVLLGLAAAVTAADRWLAGRSRSRGVTARDERADIGHSLRAAERSAVAWTAASTLFVLLVLLLVALGTR